MLQLSSSIVFLLYLSTASYAALSGPVSTVVSASLLRDPCTASNGSHIDLTDSHSAMELRFHPKNDTNQSSRALFNLAGWQCCAALLKVADMVLNH